MASMGHRNKDEEEGKDGERRRRDRQMSGKRTDEEWKRGKGGVEQGRRKVERREGR